MNEHFGNEVRSGAIVLVCGAAGTIGRATCESLRRTGAQVVGIDLHSGAGDFEVDDWIEADVTSESGWHAAVQAISSRCGRLDCLVNLAGICTLERFTETTVDLWRKMSAVNVESVLLGMQACLPLLLESGAKRPGGASIVNLSSAAGLRGTPFAAAYSASKAAVTLLSKTAAKEFAALGYPVRVNSVHPASVESTMMSANCARLVEIGAAPTIEDARDRFMQLHPMRRFAQPHEIASVIVFLCSEASSYVNGSEILIDGAVTA